MEAQDVWVFPLAIPLLAGPGALPFLRWILAGAVLLTLLAAAGAMFLSSLLLKLLGRTGVSVLERLMGIIPAGLSIQFIYDGLLALHIV